MLVEGVDLGTLAERVGTPYYCYSGQTISAAYSRWRDAFAAVGFGAERHRTCFAVKANSALAVLRHLAAHGAEFDVVSGGELHRVLRAGGAAEQVVFSGPGKSVADLRHALRVGVGLINIEVPGEVDRLHQLAAETGRTTAVGLRLNPDVDPNTHPAITTGPRQTKFGLAPDEIEDLLRRGALSPPLQVRAIAVHIGSQVADLDPMADAAAETLRWARRLGDAGHEVEWIDIGGGLAIPYDAADRVPTPEAFAARIATALQGWSGGLITEPGRVIVGPAGWLVTRVTAMRRRGDRGLLVCDTGMNALLRPALYDAHHAVEAVEEVGAAGQDEVWDVVGPLCEEGDVLARGIRLPAISVGSLLVVRDVGAYGFVMSSEYNTHPRPAQVWVEGERWATITPRPSFEDMLKGEQLAPWQQPVVAEPGA